MKILVLGGNVFLGRHLVQAALDLGHDVTLLNRGRHGPGLFPQARHLRGDRDADLGALRGARFDAVLDCSGYTPQQVRRTLDALPDVAHYTFISSVSVYAAFPPGRRFDERAAVTAHTEGYGGEKARAEEVLAAALPGRLACVRPGLIVGPFDPTGRFTYWPSRVARGGEVLAPGRPERSVQFIDARDLALWCLLLASRRTAGLFNAVGPALTMAQLLEACRAAAGAEVCDAGDARFLWLDDETLREEKVEPWTGLPLWIPEDDADFGGMLLADNRRAVDAGLITRPVAQTVADTLEWARNVQPAAGPAAGTAAATLTPQREAECLARHRPRA